MTDELFVCHIFLRIFIRLNKNLLKRYGKAAESGFKIMKKIDEKRLLDALFIPKDAVLKEYNISMVGNGQIFIEGFEAIKELGNGQIKLRVKGGFLIVTGRSLYVEYFGDGEIMIRGTIMTVQIC